MNKRGLRLVILLSCCLLACVASYLDPYRSISPKIVALNLLFLGLPTWLSFEVIIGIYDHIRNHEAWEKVRPEPSKWGEFFILVFAQKKDAEALMGDLAELYDRELATGMSRRRVRARYWGRLVKSIFPEVWAKLKNFGLIGLLLAWLRGQVS